MSERKATGLLYGLVQRPCERSIPYLQPSDGQFVSSSMLQSCLLSVYSSNSALYPVWYTSFHPLSGEYKHILFTVYSRINSTFSGFFA